MSSKEKKPKIHNAHVLIPEEIWKALKRIGDRRNPKVSVTALLIEGARSVISDNQED